MISFLNFLQWLKISKNQDISISSLFRQTTEKSNFWRGQKVGCWYATWRGIALKNIRKLLRNIRISLEIMKNVVTCYIIFYTAVNVEESPYVRRRTESTKMWFYRKMMWISWTGQVTNEDIFKNWIGKGNLEFASGEEVLGFIMRREGFENFIFTAKIEVKWESGKKR